MPCQEYWFALYLETPTSEDLTSACVSEEPASTVHPSEATWYCECIPVPILPPSALKGPLRNSDTHGARSPCWWAMRVPLALLSTLILSRPSLEMIEQFVIHPIAACSATKPSSFTLSTTCNDPHTVLPPRQAFTPMAQTATPRTPPSASTAGAAAALPLLPAIPRPLWPPTRRRAPTTSRLPAALAPPDRGSL